MSTIQLLIIILSSSFTGWIISRISIKVLFWPLTAINFGLFKMHGILPATHKGLSKKIGETVQQAFAGYDGLEEKAADPALLEKLKPEIETHIDHFLKEKLKTVFPILAQFMGDKTINQFKGAFLVEIDNLLPVLIRNYMGQLKQEIRLDLIVSEKINSYSISEMKKAFYSNTVKQRMYFSLACTVMGLFMGIITMLLLLIVSS